MLIIFVIAGLSNFAITQDRSVVPTSNPQIQQIVDLNTESTAVLIDWLNETWIGVDNDAIKSVQIQYDDFGQLVKQTRLDSGKPIIVTKNDLPLFAYTGKLFDKITDLQWNINRWYDSNAGKWISEDPIGFIANDFNFYRYVRNSSVILIDSTGL
ncbi:MAG: RHS repeat-associated core domain-containing protein [Planctomycetaceae bacterium]|jgi:RHS repeat-associated protein|nr:RHS repeat-associated core domain-containing protein [Planctomycetaceae bacterium]